MVGKKSAERSGREPIDTRLVIIQIFVRAYLQLSPRGARLYLIGSGGGGDGKLSLLNGSNGGIVLEC